MRIVGVNVRHGGGRRSARLGRMISGHRPDAVLLSEAKQSSDFESLVGAEWRRQPEILPDENAAAILSADLNPVHIEPTPTIPRMMSAGEVDGWILLSVYLPGKHTGLKPSAWADLLAAAAKLSDRPTILVGDLNTGAPIDRESPVPLQCEDQFESLSRDLGWTDLWRRSNPNTTEHTWISNSGNGFRLDHAFVSPAGLSKIRDLNCFYDHRFRTDHATDHSAIVIDI